MQPIEKCFIWCLFLDKLFDNCHAHILDGYGTSCHLNTAVHVAVLVTPLNMARYRKGGGGRFAYSFFWNSALMKKHRENRSSWFVY